MNEIRKQARAMELPAYPCPPSVRDIPTHAASWGWVPSSRIAQDEDGQLWADGAHVPKPELYRANGGHRALLAWAPDGLAVWVDKRGYGSLARIDGVVDPQRWVPVAEVMNEMPGYADAFRVDL